ncbi:hypothetical protein Bhyg_06589 [Pseudolycoriella hygida]|uniref:Glycine zipper domain-containing protein n=1 Tax=Pseudolycoriella hygida TaxID=35572 RepID=A0A9Q0N2U9_9DIPT|nr:hypothetical protein Bhyg_06589 [Pseudolycoriella hygida]
MFDNPAADQYACALYGIDWAESELAANKMIVDKAIEIGKPAVKGAVKGAVVGAICKGPVGAVAGGAAGAVGGVYDHLVNGKKDKK